MIQLWLKQLWLVLFTELTFPGLSLSAKLHSPTGSTVGEIILTD